ncbi:MAG TPA: hypothetical protein VI603_17615 [Saprospiraceae bacterium]|nr:hypothetical protein [Saprospiraceae bacterium]
MEKHLVKIESIDKVTHNVLRIVTAKPAGYQFTPGQATEIAINKDGWEGQKRPFSFTSLPVNSNLEFTIKTYPERHGVTNELLHLKKNDELILHEVFGAIAYKGEGVFIAGGAGVTPFICIFRQLNATGKIGNNMLVFANNTIKDIILEEEFRSLLGDAFINILSKENTAGYYYGQISESFLRSHIDNFDQHFYVCGPPPMMETVLSQLSYLGVQKDAITVEDL